MIKETFQMQQSDDKTIKLRNLHLDMTGTYTCEVSTEGIFETVQASARMTVIALPRGGPHIQGQDRYRSQMPRIGDEISLNCTSLKSKPAAKLVFYMNNKKVSGRHNIHLEERHIFKNAQYFCTTCRILRKEQSTLCTARQCRQILSGLVGACLDENMSPGIHDHE